MMSLLRNQWFSFAMLGLFLLAWTIPSLAQTLGGQGWTKLAAVVLIFFCSGLSLKTQDSLRSLTQYRLHLHIHFFSFVLIPILVWLLVRLFGGGLPEGLVIGFYLLAVVPTTISSCAVFTQLAGGNFAAALFNAVSQNMLGIVISPLLLALLLGSGDQAMSLDARGTIVQLCLIVLLPFVAGQLLNTWVTRRLPSIRATAGHVNRFCLLVIIYLAFGDLFIRDHGQLPVMIVILAIALLIPAHLLLLALAWHSGNWMGFDPRDRITILFCGPQKTVALGLPMIAALLAHRPDLLGLAALPLVAYHTIQLVTAGIVEPRVRLRSTVE